jgi:murein DD-endopeptidase MepM/ murein hydrolase activator NlpD
MRRILALLGLVTLAACGNPPQEAPRGLPPLVNEASPATLGTGGYVVQQGDTIYSIARQLHVSVRALIDANQMQPPFQVWAGQRLVLPGSGFYLVSKGDNLTVIAKKTGVPFGTLARMNNLSAPYVLQVGQKLILPASAGGSSPAPQTSVVSLSPQAAQPAPVSTATASSAPQAAVTVSSLPPIGNAAPAPAPAPVSVPAAPAPVSAPISNPTQTASLPTAPLPEPPVKSGKGFIWPLKGEVIASYGATGKGQNNDGINIAAPRGTPVMAAESGVVAYAGNELRGFGNLLLIKHEGGWMTAYAHNDTLLVKRGDVVKRGQKIAKVGDSGGVSQPQLHFEVRQGTRAVDPATVLGSGSIPANAPLDPSEPG